MFLLFRLIIILINSICFYFLFSSSLSSFTFRSSSTKKKTICAPSSFALVNFQRIQENQALPKSHFESAVTNSNLFYIYVKD